MRATVQTGRYGFRTGVGTVGGPGLPLEEVTLAEMLALGTEDRYATCAIGKWHIGSVETGGIESPNRAGYDHFSGQMSNLGDYYSYKKVVDGRIERITRYATTDQVDDALTWIESWHRIRDTRRSTWPKARIWR